MVTFKKYTILTAFIMSLLIVLLSHCSTDLIWKDDELSIQRTPYTENNLRIDGYYYELIDGSLYGVHCFYNNGIIQYMGGGYKQINLSDFEQALITQEFINKGKEVKYYWGVFKIDGSMIEFERWYPSEPPLKAYVRAGQILNDTTFLITEFYRMQKGKKTEIKPMNETYHFQQFSPKPDSTNVFVP